MAKVIPSKKKVPSNDSVSLLEEIRAGLGDSIRKLRKKAESDDPAKEITSYEMRAWDSLVKSLKEVIQIDEKTNPISKLSDEELLEKIEQIKGDK